MLGSRLIIIGSVLFLLVYIYHNYFKILNRRIGIFIGTSVFIFSFVILVVWSIPSIKARLVDEFFDKYSLEPATGMHYNSLNTRISELTCGFNIIKNNYFWGVGTGDVQDELNVCYQISGYSPVLYQQSYNPHNQFIHTYAGLGFLGFATLVFILINLFKEFDLKNKVAFTYAVFCNYFAFPDRNIFWFS